MSELSSGTYYYQLETNPDSPSLLVYSSVCAYDSEEIPCSHSWMKRALTANLAGISYIPKSIGLVSVSSMNIKVLSL